MFSYGCQQILINPDSNLKAVLEFICEESNKLANCGIYYSRQLYFKTGKIAHKYELHKILGNNPHFKAFQCHVAQQCLTSVAESFNSFIGLLKGIKSGTVDQKPRLPNYRTKDGLNVVTFLKNDVKLKDKGLRFPLGSKVKAWFGLNAFYMAMPSNLDYKSIKEYRILPRNGCFYLELVYKVETVTVDVDDSRVLGIDHGLNNWLSCLSNVGTSFLDSDSLPVFGAKPEGWKPSGKRLKRGLYRSLNGTKINADCNGAGNIIRKVAATLGINLDGVSSGALMTPLRVRLWAVHESPCWSGRRPDHESNRLRCDSVAMGYHQYDCTT